MSKLEKSNIKNISISDFNSEKTEKIFDEVKVLGHKVVYNNGSPEFVILSFDEYKYLIDKLEEKDDIILAQNRLSSTNPMDIISQQKFEEEFKIDFDTINPIREDCIKL